MLTPQKIQDLSDPIESVYIAMTNELLVNIGRHITSPTWTHTAAWEIQKLSELGQLTQENAAIINRGIKSLPQEIRDTMEETRRLALEDIEKQMERAAKAGYLTPPERDSTINVLQEYSQQAADQLNLVNTTMLRSSLQQYARMVQLTAEIERQAEQTQAILNEAAGSVATGTETRTQALNRAIRRISEEGLAGFYDKAGRSWSPEAYVNMDIRTTVHNVAIQSVKNRMEDYNTQVFQVSAHAGARPLCYPFQGKLYSWNNTAGEIETGNGRMMHYEPLNSTSYGEPAGLFGINCGHFPIPVIPGVTIPHAQDFVQPKEENDRQYAESQQQRALERKIRAAKRALEMGDRSPEAKERVKAAQEEMRQFIKATGRTRRPDRESLYGGKKAPTPPKNQRPTPGSRTDAQPATQPARIEPPTFTPAKTKQEAEEYGKKFADSVSYKGVSVENANRINQQLDYLTAKYPIKRLDEIEGKSSAVMSARYNHLGINGRLLGKTLEEEQKTFQEEQKMIKSSLQTIRDRFKGYAKLPTYIQLDIEKKEKMLKFKRYGVHSSYDDHVIATVTHEYGHILSDQYFGMINKERANPNYSTNWKLREMGQKWDAAFRKAQETGDIFKLSKYGATNVREFFAESFVAREMGEQIPDYVESLFKEVLKNGIM